MMRVRFVSIPVTDQDQSLAFYRDKLDFEVVTDQPFGSGQRWIELRPPGSETLVVLTATRSYSPAQTSSGHYGAARRASDCSSSAFIAYSVQTAVSSWTFSSESAAA